MPNILINPSSGILEFNTGIAGGSVFDTSLSGAARLTFNSGEINLVSYSTGVTDRFTVDGAAGRLFSVSDALTGSIFSVNDIAGLPLIEVVSTTGDTITIGPYNTNTLVVKDTNVGIGTGAPSSNLEVYGATKIASARNNQFPLTIYGGNSSAQACHVLLYNNVTRGVLKAGGNGLDGQGFADSSYNYLLFVSGNGNVGVGTTSPSYKLDVDGTGNFRSGLYSNGNPVLTTASSNVVFTTGNQVIVGNKTFSGDLKASSLSIEPGNLTINDNVFSGAVMSLSEGSSFVINGIGGSQIDLYGQTITGFSIYSNDIYKNGYSVLTTNDTGNFLTTSSNAVYTTGNQTIAGEKTFSSTIKSSNTSSIFQANGGNLSGNLEIIKIGNYYSFRLGQTGSWDEEYGNSTQLTLGNGLNGDGSNPGFTLYDFSNGGTFQVGSLISYGPYNGSTIRMGSDGIALWGNDGGDITISNGGVGINTNGSTPFYSLDVAGSIKGNEYFSSAGNSGITTSITVYDQNAAINKTLNFENGLLISIT